MRTFGDHLVIYFLTRRAEEHLSALMYLCGACDGHVVTEQFAVHQGWPWTSCEQCFIWIASAVSDDVGFTWRCSKSMAFVIWLVSRRELDCMKTNVHRAQLTDSSVKRKIFS